MENNNTNDTNIDIHDRVTEAYYGELGEKMMQETQHRMHWIRDNVVGTKILDIGCSQGIGPILLGRLGKKVTGVDISQKAVDEANEALEKEESAVKEKVNFKKSDFLAYDANKEQFDTITITEVLEHLVNPEDFIEKAKELLVDNGTLIVTVPFGINDHIDHKKTYYFLDLYQMIYKDFDLKDVSILGKWIGFIATKRFSSVTQIPNSISFQSLKTVEDAFYVTERELVDTIKSNSQLLNDYRKYIFNLKTELSMTKESLSYRLGHTLLHEKKKLINPLEIFQKIRTINKIRKERKNNA